MIQLLCECGSHLQVLELYAGGTVLCQVCGRAVPVAVDTVNEEKFRFHCPHCEARVVARKASAGKKSQCPACEKIYVVPMPAAAVEPLHPEANRIRIDSDDLLVPSGLPFRVGLRNPSRAEEPTGRYIHSHDEDQPGSAIAPSRPTPSMPEPSPPVSNLRLPPRTASSDESPQAMKVITPRANVGELIVIGGSCAGQRIPLTFHRFLVGAERDCNLRPDSSLISRHHCVFKRDEYALRIRDLGSRNGTFVNGRRIAGEVILNPGDEVAAGDLKLSVILPCPPHVTQLSADSRPSISEFVIL